MRNLSGLVAYFESAIEAAELSDLVPEPSLACKSSSTPACTRSSDIDPSSSSMRFPISSMRSTIASDIDSNLKDISRGEGGFERSTDREREKGKVVDGARNERELNLFLHVCNRKKERKRER